LRKQIRFADFQLGQRVSGTDFHLRQFTNSGREMVTGVVRFFPAVMTIPGYRDLEIDFEV